MEEWIKEKAEKWLAKNYDNSWNISPIRFVQLLEDFTNSLAEKIPTKKVTMTEETLKKEAGKLAGTFISLKVDFPTHTDSSLLEIEEDMFYESLKQMLTEAGVEVLN